MRTAASIKKMSYKHDHWTKNISEHIISMGAYKLHSKNWHWLQIIDLWLDVFSVNFRNL